MKSHTKLHILNFSAANCSMPVDVKSTRRTAARSVAARAAVVLSAAVLAACGGGGGGGSTATDGSVSLASVKTGYITQPTTPTLLTPVTPATSTPATVTAGTVLTDVRIQNTGAAQTNVPFTFGQVFAVGQLSPSEGLAAKMADGTVIRLQTDVKATHPDGSVRHAIISGILPSLAAGQVQKIELAKSTASPRSTVTVHDLLDAGLTSNVTITVDKVKYTASLAEAVAKEAQINWLSGTIANEWIASVPLKNEAGIAHPLLTARFAVRWYNGLTRQARVEVVVENNKTFAAGARNLTYDVNVEVAGRSVYRQNNLTHYHHARWHQYAWWDASREPAINIQHNTAYLIASKAVSNYDQNLVIPESALASLGNSINPSNTGPMKIGPVLAYMGTTGGRGDIGPLPGWSVNYLLTMDKRAKDVMMAAAEGSASWSVHYRDEKTNYPVRTDNDANKRISTHGNLSNYGPLPVPRCANNDWNLCSSPYGDDTAHQPSLVYLPYLVTGEYYYLEELQFWAAWNPLGTDPNYSGLGQGLVRWQQVRGQAWSLRTLGHTAYITPDADPMKSYFTKQLDANLDFYSNTYVVGNPNNLGMYDGSGSYAFEITEEKTWQDDFLTWSFGYLSELGFTKALPILQWKAKFPVGRMTAPGFCWIQAGIYSMKMRENNNSPKYDSFADMYKGNFGYDNIANDDGGFVTVPSGTSYQNMECGSQQQADYLGLINRKSWPRGRMAGYADSGEGYPANMQPALAVAATSGIPNAAQAWATYDSRAAKPDFRYSPQFAIVPR